MCFAVATQNGVCYTNKVSIHNRNDMSGHSKWHNIQHKKAKNDKARGAMFTKLIKSITVAAGEGGPDLDMNFSLRLAVEKAKAGNVPKDNIERAIKRGSGEGKEGVTYEHTLYEGFGPGGIALLIECLTDNKNRSVSDVKLILSKKGGSSAGQGSVQWQFEHKGMVRFSAEKKNAISEWDDAQLTLMDAGVVEALLTLGVTPDDSSLEWVAKELVACPKEKAAQLEALLDAFDENDDVKAVYTNAL